MKRDLTPLGYDAPALGTCIRAKVVAIEEDGALRVVSSYGEWLCDRLMSICVIDVGESVLVLPPEPDGAAVVIGKIVRRAVENINITASSTLKLSCGTATLEMHSDGDILLKGEELVLRAKGTQRIRAGTVSIN